MPPIASARRAGLREAAHVLRRPLDQDVDVAGVADVTVGIHGDASGGQVLDPVALQSLENPHRVEWAAVELGG
jgi:hypothetical protein